MTGTSGPTSPTPFAYYDPASRSLRTSQTTFDLGLPTSSPTLPASGSMRSGALRARRRSALPTSGAACSSSPGLPTPRARDSKGRGYEDGLPAVVELLPTPTVSEATGPQPNTGRTGGRSLRETLLPTPRASANENRQTRRTPSQEAGRHGLNLAAEVCSLLPTPTAAEADRTSATYPRGNPTLSGALLPTPKATNNENRQSLDRYGPNLGMALQALNGAPTPPRSTGGPASSAVPHPHQLSLDEPDPA